MVKKAKKNNNDLNQREMIFAAVIIILLLLLVWWWFAAKNNWWPMNNSNSDSLNASQIEKIEGAATDASAANKDTAGSGSGNGSGGAGSGNNGGTGANGSNGSNGNSGSNGGGGSTTTPATDSAFIRFSGGLGTGQNRQQVNAAASGLSQSCSVVANITTAGKQEVCLYREGSKLITATFLNDQVISVARTGF